MGNKKIGILTFHNAHNYGASLQAYALKTKLTKLGCDTSIINYRNQAIEQSYPTQLSSLVNKSIWYRIFHRIEYKRKLKEACFRQEDWEQQYNKFEGFINQYLLEDNLLVENANSIEKLDYDVIIIGSDQVWSEFLTGGIDPVYYGDIKTNAMLATYAASKFEGEFDSTRYSYVKKCFSNFRFLSVREKHLADSISKITNMSVETVVDPTLLLDEKDYFEIMKGEPENKRYILVYYLIENRDLALCADYLREKTGLDIIEVHYYKVNNTENKILSNLGPSEFLYYFYNADYILTNSYHGCIFSIIFKKKFWAIYSNDTRKDDLLKMYKLEERHKINLDDFRNELNVDVINYEIDKPQRIIESENFLKDLIRS